MLKVFVICLALGLSACRGDIHDLVDGCEEKQNTAYQNGREQGRAEVNQELLDARKNQLFYGVRVKIVDHFYKGQKGTIVNSAYGRIYYVVLDFDRTIERSFDASNLEVIR